MKPKGIPNRVGVISTILLIFAAAALAIVVTLLVVILRQNALLRTSLDESNKAQAEKLAALDERLTGVSDRVDQIGQDIERQIASNRDKASSDVGRLESRLNRRLSDLSGLMTRPVPERIVEVPAPAQAAAPSGQLAAAPSVQQPAAPSAPQAAGPAAAAPASAASEAPVEQPAPPLSRKAEEDLALIQAMKQGQERYKAGKFAEAAALYQTVMDKQPDNLDARLYYSASLFKANPGASSNYPRIEQSMKSVLQERREDPLAIEILGLLASERERWTEAVEWLSQVAALEPGDATVLQETGVCAFYASDYKNAEKYLDMACAAAPQRAGIWFEAGNAYAADGNNGEAASRYEKCLAADPRYTAAHFKAGLAYQALKHYGEALTHLNAYISERADFESLSAAGDCAYAGGDRAQAEIRWRQSLAYIKGGTQDSERTGVVYEKLVRSAWERSDFAQCESWAREGLDKGKRPLLQAYLGMSLAARGDAEQGNAVLRKVIEEHPGTEAAALAARDLEKRGEQ